MSVNFTIKKGGDTFGADDVLALTYYVERSPVSETLSADTFSFEVDSQTVNFSAYKYGDELVFTEDSSVKGKFYFKSFKQLSPTRYLIECISAVGLMQTAEHKGGVYRGVSAGDLIADVLGAVPVNIVSDPYTYSGIVDYQIDAEVASVPLYGYLAYQKVAEALQQILFATGAGLMKNASGDVYFKYPRVSAASPISDDDVYVGGSIEDLAPATAVTVAEHMFYALSSDIERVLFDNADGSGEAIHKEIVFDNPMHDLAVSGTLTIESSGVNYAVVTGTGILTGKEYTHTKRVLNYPTGVTGAENVVSVENATLVSVVNSGNTARRVVSYYAAPHLLTRDIVLEDEKPGDYVQIKSPLGTVVTGTVRSLAVTVSGIDKATATVLAGFQPQYFGNNYEHFTLMTSSGSFTVPAGVTELRMLISGGGTGGGGGERGTTGYDNGDTLNNRHINPGGAPGTPGDPGKILTVDLQVIPGTVITVVIGDGGAAGPAGTPGSAGQESTATVSGTTYTSADGAVPENGVVNLITGDIYSLKGEEGVAGAPGGDQGSANYGGDIVHNGTTYHGGQGCDQVSNLSGEISASAGGGGAALGSNGGDAYGDGGMYNSHTGNGATPVDASDSNIPGGGGPAGHGGGGAGKSMPFYYYVSANPGYWEWGFWSNSYGSAGAGSKGGKGGKGYVLFYY